MRTPHTHDLLIRKLLNRSDRVPLTDAVRGKLSAAGLPAASHRECICFRGAMSSGYGRMWNGVSPEYVHRISYRINVGPIPEGKDVLHVCDVPSCWEPSHLWTGTHADNMADRDAKGRGGSWKLKGRKMGPSPLRGTRHPKAKLTPDILAKIRQLAYAPYTELPKELRAGEFWRNGQVKRTALAEYFGVSESLVTKVLSGKAWAWMAAARPEYVVPMSVDQCQPASRPLRKAYGPRRKVYRRGGSAIPPE